MRLTVPASYLLKAITIGEVDTGKTSYMNAHLGGVYSPVSNYNTESRVKTYHVLDNEVKFELLDYHHSMLLQPGYYVGSFALLLFFDLNRKESLNGLKLIVEQIPFSLLRSDIRLVLIGSKADLEREVGNAEIVNFMNFVRKKQLEIRYYEVSVLKKINVERPMIDLLMDFLNIDKRCFNCLQLVEDIRFKDGFPLCGQCIQHPDFKKANAFARMEGFQL